MNPTVLPGVVLVGINAALALLASTILRRKWQRRTALGLAVMEGAIVAFLLGLGAGS